MLTHQYISRDTNSIITEDFFHNRIIRFLYSTVRENSSKLFRALTGERITDILGYMNFDAPMIPGLLGNTSFLSKYGINLSESIEPPEYFDTPRKIFERKIRYWECRPMTNRKRAVASPADSKVTIGSFNGQSRLYIKDKFFYFDELIGSLKLDWQREFKDGDYAIFRLTPDKYHYNHSPVTGRVLDFYSLPGYYNSCNPSAVIEEVTPYSKNKRFVTIIDTDVPGGTGVGLVAMIEVVALMIGLIVQCYSEDKYDNPVELKKGMILRKGAPKSLYRPGSSTDILIFQQGKVNFAQDLVKNRFNNNVKSLFSRHFGRVIVETDVSVRSLIALKNSNENKNNNRFYIND